VADRAGAFDRPRGRRRLGLVADRSRPGTDPPGPLAAGREPQPPGEQVPALDAARGVGANAGENQPRFARRSSFVGLIPTKDERRGEGELVLEAVGVAEAQRERVAGAVEPGGDDDACALEATAPVVERSGVGNRPLQSVDEAAAGDTSGGARRDDEAQDTPVPPGTGVKGECPFARVSGSVKSQ
jgi:hypothetical protein